MSAFGENTFLFSNEYIYDIPLMCVDLAGTPLLIRGWTAPHSPPPLAPSRGKRKSAYCRTNHSFANWPRSIQTEIPSLKFVSVLSMFGKIIIHFHKCCCDFYIFVRRVFDLK